MKELITKLQKQYPQLDTEILLITQNLERIEQAGHNEQKALLQQIQTATNKLWTEKQEETVIDLQVHINTLRNKYDITDTTEIINYCEDGGYVQ